MRISITENSPDLLVFSLQNADNSFANALRRVILAEIPMLAIDIVKVHANTSVTTDEMLVHRLGLVPIWSEVALEMNFPWACPCKERGLGCSRCTIELELDAFCRKNEDIKQITTDNLRVVRGPLADKIFPPGSTTLAKRPIWITSLGPGQAIQLHCKVHKGLAKQHAKFMPVSALSMRYEADILVLNEKFLSKEGASQKIVEACPAKVFALNPSGEGVDVANPELCIFCRDCEQIEGIPHGAVQVVHKEASRNKYNFKFCLEGVGSLAPIKIVCDAMEILRSKLRVIDAQLCGNSAISFTQQSHAAGNVAESRDEIIKMFSTTQSEYAQTEVLSAAK